MIQTIKKMLLLLGTTLTFTMSAAVPVAAQVDNCVGDPIRGGLSHGANTLNVENATDPCADPGGGVRVNGLIRQIINIFSVLVGVVAVIMIIVGGFRYITSGGAAEKVSGAKNTILYALIGLIIVALSQIIVRFVLSKVG